MCYLLKGLRDSERIDMDRVMILKMIAAFLQIIAIILMLLT